MSYLLVDTAKGNFEIDVEVVTPLLQIEPTSSADKDPTTKASMVRTKKRYYAENGKLSKYPFYSANGIRGVLRRNITATIFGALEEKDNNKINVPTAHLYASGGGTSNDGINALNYAEKELFREANPYLGIFGAGLSDIDGKLSVTDMSPEDKSKQMIDYLYGVRFDETERQSILSPLINSKSVEEYKERLDQKRKENAKLRKIESDIEKLQKTLEGADEEDSQTLQKIEDLKLEAIKIAEDKGMSYQQVYKAEFIIPGTKLFSSIGTRAGHIFTDIEKGMLLHGLIRISQQQIGSYSRIGWGILNWHVKDSEGKTLFKTTSNEKYLLQRNVDISEEGKKVLKPFEEYMEKLERESIFTF